MLNIHSAILNPPLVPMTIYGGISSYSIAFNRQEDFTFHGRCASMDASMDDTARGWRWVALGGAGWSVDGVYPGAPSIFPRPPTHLLPLMRNAPPVVAAPRSLFLVGIFPLGISFPGSLSQCSPSDSSFDHSNKNWCVRVMEPGWITRPIGVSWRVS